MVNERALINELCKLPNVGPAVARDLMQLGVTEVSELARMDPDEMYDRMCRISGARQDPCVWDTFAAVVDYAKGGPPRPWWDFTPIRKKHWAEHGRS